MKTITLSVALLSIMFHGCGKIDQPVAKNTSPETHEEIVKRGEYLVEVHLCNDCHSPKLMTPQGPIPDPARLLSGFDASQQYVPVADPAFLQTYAVSNMDFTAWQGPWGVSFSGNLTPDVTGLGEWSYENFRTAMREGKYKGMTNGRDLLPPMPWPSFKHLPDNDLEAIWAYLQSIPPISNLVPVAAPPIT